MEPGPTVPDDLNPVLKSFFMKIQSQYFTGLNHGYIPAVIEILTQIHEKGNQGFIGKTLGVTRKTINILEKSNYKHMIPQAVIAALGRDLGELDQIKANGDHVFHSLRLVQKILENAHIESDDILLAIRLHHEEPSDVEGSTPIAIALNLALREFKETASPTVKPKEPPTSPQVLLYSKEDILGRIYDAIDPYGFSVFFFEGKIYVSTRELKNLIPKNDPKHGKPHNDGFEKEVKRLLNLSPVRCQLKFKNKNFKPTKSRFYLFDEHQFNKPILGEKKIIPRDGEGRWLRKINIIEEEEPHEPSN